MKAHKLPTTELLELRNPDGKRVEGSPLYKRFVGGLAWLNPAEGGEYAKNWGFIIGEREDKDYTFFAEFSGDMATLAAGMINWKDRLLCDRFYASDEDELILRDLRAVDGLTRYNSHKDKMDREVYEHKPETWPYYRDRHTKAVIIPVAIEVRGNLQAGFELIQRLKNANKAEFRWETSVFESLIYQNPPYDRVLSHPCMQAAILAILMLERTKSNMATPKQQRAVYSNLR